MAKRGRSISRGKSRSQSRSRSQRGGNYSSASSYGSYVNGTPNEQFARTFDVAGPYGGRTGSEYVGAQGQWANQPASPSAQNLTLIQSAGRRRSASRGRSAARGRSATSGRTSSRGRSAPRGRSATRGRTRRGGFWGEVINQAIAPLAILGMQQTYKKRK